MKILTVYRHKLANTFRIVAGDHSHSPVTLEHFAEYDAATYRGETIPDAALAAIGGETRIDICAHIARFLVQEELPSRDITPAYHNVPATCEHGVTVGHAVPCHACLIIVQSSAPGKRSLPGGATVPATDNSGDIFPPQLMTVSRNIRAIIAKAEADGLTIDDGNVIDLLCDNISNASIFDLRCALVTAGFSERFPRATSKRP